MPSHVTGSYRTHHRMPPDTAGRYLQAGALSCQRCFWPWSDHWVPIMFAFHRGNFKYRWLGRKTGYCGCPFQLIADNTLVPYAARYKVLESNPGPAQGMGYHQFYRAMHFSAKRGIAIACRLSVRLSVTLVFCDHIGWNSSKIISPSVSLGRSLFATPTRRVCSKGNTPKFLPE